MIKYTINKNDYTIEKKFYIERLELDNIIAFDYFEPHINILINFFNQEYKWDGMFNIDDVKKRIINGHIMFILYYDNCAIGYVWFKEINVNTCFGYNLYVTKKIDRPKYSAKWFYNEVTGIMLKEYYTIKVEIEDWNKVVFDLVESIGYKQC
jgi:hypothetical protein